MALNFLLLNTDVGFICVQAAIKGLSSTPQCDLALSLETLCNKNLLGRDAWFPSSPQASIRSMLAMLKEDYSCIHFCLL
jgi:hypothetical protein